MAILPQKELNGLQQAMRDRMVQFKLGLRKVFTRISWKR
jgi:hypothetical protein